MTRIGLVSDAHNHLASFKRALDIFDRVKVDHILCAGDMIARGAGADAMIEALKQRQIPMVRGNHEGHAIAYQDELRTWESFDAHPERVDHLMTDRNLNYVRTLPRFLTAEYDGVRLYMTHAVPWSEDDVLYPHHVEACRRVIAEANADIVILGHTHVGMFLQVGQAVIVNPGATWSSFSESYQSCAVLSLPETIVTYYHLKTMHIFSIAGIIKP